MSQRGSRWISHSLGLEPGVNRLSDHNPLWAEAFFHEAARIRAALGPLVLGIEHYGSTAVAGLKAKPVIDMLVGVAQIDDGLKMVGPLTTLGYDYAGDQVIPGRHIFGLGFARTHLVHVVVYGGRPWAEALAFRDRLRADAALRALYEALKQGLVETATTRAEYTAGKAPFISASLSSGP